jgi:hypothetical protein
MSDVAGAAKEVAAGLAGDKMVKTAATDEKMEVVAADRAVANFLEKTFNFLSKRTHESSYMCSVFFQHPEDEVYSVSVYLVETYLGQFAFRKNMYFRGSSRGQALECYDKASDILSKLREKFSKDEMNQRELPYILRRDLQDVNGEVQSKHDKVATYLDPANQPRQSTVGSENIVYIPKGKKLSDDLLLQKKK